MEYRKLGRTGLEVSAVGLGTEYLNKRPTSTVVSVIRAAIQAGVNYFDMVFSFPEYRDNLGAAFRGYRERVLLAGHICTAETNGHYRMSRDVAENETLFHDLLARLQTDHVDVLFIQMVNSMEGYDEVMRPGGIMELAQRLKQQGKARFIGMSGHRPPAALAAVHSGMVDVWMFPINLAWDLGPGRKAVSDACADAGVGLVAMKPFAGGKLFKQKDRGEITPVQCLHYVLSQRGVTSAVPGVKGLKELNAVLHYAEATAEEKDFAPILDAFQQDVSGNCVYCNHCMPCPAGIDIGEVMRKLDQALQGHEDRSAGSGGPRERMSFYYPPRIRTSRSGPVSDSAPPAACMECGECEERCPFDVDVIVRMKRAAELFG
jgi:predicted aldo/keto reductase-like oxidoreductase